MTFKKFFKKLEGLLWNYSHRLFLRQPKTSVACAPVCLLLVFVVIRNSFILFCLFLGEKDGRLSYKGVKIHRIIKNFMLQGFNLIKPLGFYRQLLFYLRW
jgi:hypothetical protein